MIDFVLLAVLFVVTWCVSGEGAWGAVLTFFAVLFAGLLTMNFYEPFAIFLDENVLSSYEWRNRWDIIAFCLLFAGFVFALRFATDYLLKVDIPIHGIAYDGVRWIAGGATGYLTMAILLTALHTAPLPREFIGFRPERQNFFGVAAPDRHWLAFTQYVTERAYRHREPGRIFDGSIFSVVSGRPPQVWPSFPIRYATRREQYASGGSPTTSDTPSGPPPSSSGGAPTNAF